MKKYFYLAVSGLIFLSISCRKHSMGIKEFSYFNDSIWVKTEFDRRMKNGDFFVGMKIQRGEYYIQLVGYESVY